MWNRFMILLVLVFLLLCAFQWGRFYQVDYMLEHNDSPAVVKILDKNCIKL